MKKCPKCELNYIEDNEDLCVICKANKTPARPRSTGRTSHGYSKNEAIADLVARGYVLSENITFASKNSTSYNYWANPEVSFLSRNWTLLLYDWHKSVLHYFYIPAGSISPFEIKTRSDAGHDTKIDLQIRYNDPMFTDERSYIRFAKYHIATTGC